MNWINAHFVIVVPLLFLTAGCGYGGPPQRSGTGPDYARSVYTLYDQPKAGAAPAAVNLRFPMDTAVAEMGQVAPAPAILEGLRPQGQLFRRVEGIPALSENETNIPWQPDRNRDAQLTTIYRLGQLARGMGLDYLLLYGATVDSNAIRTELSGLDVTIVAGFVVPSWELTGRARASAVLVDLRSNTVVLTTGVESNDKRRSASVTAFEHRALLERDLRDNVLGKLDAKIIEDFGRRALFAGPATRVAEASAAPASDPFATYGSPASSSSFRLSQPDAVSSHPSAGSAPPIVAVGVAHPLPPDVVPVKSKP